MVIWKAYVCSLVLLEENGELFPSLTVFLGLELLVFDGFSVSRLFKVL